MNIHDAVSTVAPKFVYRKDRIPLFDSWRVMKYKSGSYVGDCDDFAITCFWHLSDRKLWRFLLHLIVTHNYRVHYVKSGLGGGHLVGSYGGQYFDNWTKRPMLKKDFFATTGHKYRMIIPGPIVAVYLFLGLFFD
jgi:hypothetical protein